MQISNKVLATICILMLLLPLMSLVLVMPVKAASGSITVNPTKFSSGVTTTAVLNGGVFGSGATVKVYMSPDTTFTIADRLVATVTLQAGQTSFVNTVVSISPPTVTTDTVYYIAATDDDGATWTSYVQVIVTTQAPTITINPSSQSPGRSVEVSGSGFTAGSTVTVYLSRPGGTILASTTVLADGTISVSFTIPNLAQGSYKVIAQQADTLQAEDTLTIVPSVTAPFDIAGTAGETFTITAVGLRGGKTIAPSTATAPTSTITVGGVPTYHSGGTTGTDGTLTITVTLSAAITSTGFKDVVITYTDGTLDSITNAILVSKAQNPAAPEYSQVLLVYPPPGSVSIGSPLSIIAYNFPAGASVSVYFGSSKIATMSMDGLGAGKATATVPPLPGLTPAGASISYNIIAIDNNGLQAAQTGYTITSELKLLRVDTGATISSTTYIDAGTKIRVVACGLRPLYTYTLTVTNQFPPLTLSIKTDAYGSFTTEFTVKYATGIVTGTFVSVSITPSDVSAQTFKAVGVPTFSGTPLATTTGLSFYHAAPGATVSGASITNLVPNTRYQLFIDGSLITLGGTGYPDSFVSTDAGASPAGMTFAAPTTPGVRTLSIRYYGGTVDLAKIDFIVSSPTLTDTATLVTPSISSGDTITVKAFNLPASTSIALWVSGVGMPVASDTSTSTGAIELQSSPIDLPAGSYNVRLVYGATVIVPTPSTLTVSSKLTISPSSGLIGTSVSITAKGLDPNTAYNILFGDSDLGIIGVSDGTGSLTGSFTVPTVVEGKYTVKLVPSADPTRVAASATFTVTTPSGLTLTPNPSAFPTQLATFKWSVAGLSTPIYVYVYLNDYLYQKIEDVGYDGQYIYGSFIVPNVATPGTVLKLTLKYEDSAGSSGTTYTALRVVEGRGALITGLTSEQSETLARIDTKLDTVLVNLSELNATLISIKDGVATLDTKFGTMLATLDAINAKIVSISDGVATISTTLGTVKTTLDAINAKIVSISDGVATISTTLGTVKTTLDAINAKIVSISDGVATISTTLGTVKTTLDAINAKVTSISGDVATIRTDVGTISGKISSVDGSIATIKTDLGTVKVDLGTVKADVSGLKSSVDDVKSSVGDVKETVDTVPGMVSGLMAPIWAAVVLSLIAAMAAIYSVITIRKKIAG
ncbi:MAG: hypothetical protein QXX41_11590 [Nitrososphaerota archaeon]